MEEVEHRASPTCLFGFESDASSASTPERCLPMFFGEEYSLPADATCNSFSKNAKRLQSASDHIRHMFELEASLQESQQLCAKLKIRLDKFESNSAEISESKESMSDCAEGCVSHALRCEALEQRLRQVESEKQDLQIRLSESITLYQLRNEKAKADAEIETKRLIFAVEALKQDLHQARSAALEWEEMCGAKERLLQAAHEQCKDLQKQLADIALANDFKVKSLLKSASEAATAEKEQSAAAVQAAEARAVHAKFLAETESLRCRSECERLVMELGEAKATINDYMWRCEAMQSSLTLAHQNLTSTSEAVAVAERRGQAELEALNIKAQEAQAKADSEIQLWMDEAKILQEALSESNATVDKFIEHSSNLQRRLNLSQSQCADLEKTLSRISR
jgi:hypothetical protein